MKTLILAATISSFSVNAYATSICDIGVATEVRLKQLQQSEDSLDKLLLELEKLGIEDQKACHELLGLKFDDFEKDAIADLLNSQ